MPMQKSVREARHNKVKPVYPRPTALYRHILRQARRLPDPASRYFYQTQARIRFRRSQGHHFSMIGSAIQQSIETQLNEATWHLTRLTQANMGSMNEMQQVIGLTYGIVGPVIAERAKYQSLLNFSPHHRRLHPMLPITQPTRKQSIPHLATPPPQQFNNEHSLNNDHHSVSSVSTNQIDDDDENSSYSSMYSLEYYDHLETLKNPVTLSDFVYVPFEYGQFYIPDDPVNPENNDIIRQLSIKQRQQAHRVQHDHVNDRNNNQNDDDFIVDDKSQNKALQPTSDDWFPPITIYPTSCPVHPRVLLSFEFDLEPFMYSILYFLSTQSPNLRNAFRAWPDFAWIPLEQSVYDAILAKPFDQLTSTGGISSLLGTASTTTTTSLPKF